MSIVFSVFPKFYRDLDLNQLAEMVREVGLDTTNLVVREGYWCEPATLERDVTRFVSVMAKHGLKSHFATTGFTPDALAKDSTPLQILSAHGIREFRMSYFGQAVDDARGAYDRARKELEQVANLCAKHDIRGVYQVHHGTLIPNASAAYHVINQLPAKFIGIELDPGNQIFEGSEDPAKSVSLLDEYLVAFGIKDARPVFNPDERHLPHKGWGREFCSLEEGQINWHDVIRPLARRKWSGTFVFMPFYHEHDRTLMTTTLKNEVAYLRGVVKQF
jgi:sugar phosphate isomerase/epimerase